MCVAEKKFEHERDLPFISWLDPRNEAKKVKPYAAQPAKWRPRLLASQTQPCGFRQGLPLHDSRNFAVGCYAMAANHAAKKDSCISWIQHIRTRKRRKKRKKCFVDFVYFVVNNPINASDTKDVLLSNTKRTKRAKKRFRVFRG